MANYIVETEVSNLLMRAGIAANQKGFLYLNDAILKTLKDPSLLHKLTTQLYPEIAKKYNVSCAVVERSIRHSIDVAYNSTNLFAINDMIAESCTYIDSKPCSGSLIAIMCEIAKCDLLKDYAYAQGGEKEELGRELKSSIYGFKPCTKPGIA